MCKESDEHLKKDTDVDVNQLGGWTEGVGVIAKKKKVCLKHHVPHLAF